ncbi:unnamed protein product [Amoebophrya sp. A120]|nr:unnamed protein product [Amoebophrya sp. A120]|eukprot:GSA120T00011767001.1
MAKNIRKKQAVRRKAEGKATARSKKTVTKDNNPLADRKVAKTHRGRRELKAREPKVVENAKTTLLIRGQRTKEELHQVLKDMHDLKKPLSEALFRKHEDANPFEPEGAAKIVEMCNKKDAGLFAYGCSTKKRPHRLVLGRLFNQELLDLVEFDVQDMHTFLPKAKLPTLGAKPLLLFQGAGWELSEPMQQAKSLLMDFFRGANPERVSLHGLEHVLVFTCDHAFGALPSTAAATAAAGATSSAATGSSAKNGKILFRAYRVQMKKSSTGKLPRVALEETGPRFTLALDRVKEADPAVLKLAMKVPAGAEKRKVKNEESSGVGKKFGRLHLGRQDFSKINTHGVGIAKKRKTATDQSGASSTTASTADAAMNVDQPAVA